MGKGITAAIEALERANAQLEPELMTAEHARELMAAYARAEKLVSFGIATLARKLTDTSELARATGSSMGKAKKVVATGRVMAVSDELSSAFQQGDISLDQATEIASAEESAPGCARRSPRSPKSSPSMSSKTRPARSSSRPSSTGIWVSDSATLAGPAPTTTSSAWSTSTSSSSLTSALR